MESKLTWQIANSIAKCNVPFDEGPEENVCPQSGRAWMVAAPGTHANVRIYYVTNSRLRLI